MELHYPNKTAERDILKATPVADFGKGKRYGNGSGWVNRLFHGDNLSVLKALYEDRSIRGNVQVVYIDPPYATKRKFTHRQSLDTEAYDDTLSGYEFIEFLRKRLVFLRELLSPSGSIYVHLDGNMAFHIKVIMDEVFGEGNFRNFIARQKCHSKNYTSKQYGNVTDYILFYSKSAEMKWNRPYELENKYSFEQRFPKVDPKTGKRYALVPIYASGVRNGETGQPWRGKLPPSGKHWQPKPSELERLDAIGDINWSPTGNPRRKIWAENDNGVPVHDLWTKFMDFRNQNMKETGYPTEKNAALLKRIIEASSDPSDLVLDCFCGSGTTLAVARDLGRKWIGVDESDLAIETTLKRLKTATKHAPSAAEEPLLFDHHANNGKPKPRYEAFELLRAKSVANLL